MKKIILVLMMIIAFLAIPSQSAYAAEECVQMQSMYTFEEMNQDIILLTQNYPGIVSSKIIGTTVEGRQIPEIILGNPTTAKHRVFVQSTLHAREYLGTQAVMKMVEYYAQNPALLGTTVFYIVPMANPDGVCICQYGSDSVVTPQNKDFVARTGHFKNWKANSRGVDLNRNWNAQWNIMNLHGYTGPSYEMWRGYSFETEPEVLAIKAAATEQSFELYLNIHQQGNVIYNGSDIATPAVNSLSGVWASIIHQVNGYKICGSGCIGQPSYGTFADWICTALQKPSVTLEMGSGLPPKSQSQVTGIFNKNKAVFQTIAAVLAAND